MPNKTKTASGGKEGALWELQRVLSTEFSKYVLAHPELDVQIPDGAQIVFHMEDNPEFNRWARKVAHSQMAKNQPMIVIKVAGLSPVPPSRLINPQVDLSPAT
ncbi:MAG: hypothetical protein A3G34_03495 [Candidatus Lindowbacteria bacterium RIFCSPLOWO2_12_FULL_62_27]|nr:MAG: hypothetical protein A3G34_03495 [Candidatus Lindowbacteria bacterium RIFCSPLOWO2_12_FULL_62_27]OGH62143.1 MAG: hypothetical protein A3I06_09840 [Candidatus Lindowbacteria bacterium RIFCSPLOWO2_02_FULL_62_12]